MTLVCAQCGLPIIGTGITRANTPFCSPSCGDEYFTTPEDAEIHRLCAQIATLTADRDAAREDAIRLRRALCALESREAEIRESCARKDAELETERRKNQSLRDRMQKGRKLSQGRMTATILRYDQIRHEAQDRATAAEARIARVRALAGKIRTEQGRLKAATGGPAHWSDIADAIVAALTGEAP